MTGEHTLAIDAGTGSCRAVVFDATLSVVGSGQREWSHHPEDGVPGSQRFETEANWALICECVREALSASGLRGSDILAVSATSMREGMVLWDEHGHELWACPNVDSRSADQAARLIASGDAERIYRLAGDWVSITAPARFLWLADNRPDILGRTARVGMLGDWILTRLSGEYVTDPSLGSSSGMFDLAARSWSPEIVAICGLDASIFPPVQPSGTVMGEVTQTAASETGLAQGTPVVVGGADTQLGLVGIGINQPNTITVVGGTFWQQTVVFDQPVVDPKARLRTLCHTVDDRWMMEGIGFYSGLVMRWFRDAFCQTEVERAAASGVDPYQYMDELAAGVPVGANGVVGVFSNLMQADRWVHAAPSLMGFDISDPSRSGRGECIRAIEENAAYVSRGHLDIVRELSGAGLETVVFTGGAARGSAWTQILADVLGAVVRVPEVTESTALGAALYARLAVGLESTVEEAGARAVRWNRPVEPRAAAVSTYDDLYRSWFEVNGRVLEMTEHGLLTPLWRAAGT
jgi:autoinducer 2 (AI-2) kinase